MMLVVCFGTQSFAETSSKPKTESRLNSDEGGITSSDCDSRTQPRSAGARALRQRKTVDVVDADLISYQPVQEARPSADWSVHGQSEAAKVDDGKPSIEEETAPPPEVVEQRPRHRDVRELRRRLRSLRDQRKCDDEQPQSSSERETVETRLDQLARSAVEYT